MQLDAGRQGLVDPKEDNCRVMKPSKEIEKKERRAIRRHASEHPRALENIESLVLILGNHHDVSGCSTANASVGHADHLQDVVLHTACRKMGRLLRRDELIELPTERAAQK